MESNVLAEDRNSTKCFICSSSLNDQWQLMEDGTSLFEFMCRDLLPFDFLLRPESKFRKVKNCELCDNCAALIRNGIEIEKNIEFLKNNLKTVAKTLQDLISSSYYDSQKKGSEDVTGPLKSLKTMFAQCLSTCDVSVPKIPKDYEHLLPKKPVIKEEATKHDDGAGPSSRRPRRKRKPAAVLSSAEYVVLNSGKDSTEDSAMNPEEDQDRGDEDYIAPEVELESDQRDHRDVSGRSEDENRTSEAPRKKRRVTKKKDETPRKPHAYLSYLCKFCNQKFLKEDFKTPDGSYRFECKFEKCPKLLTDFRAFRRHHTRFCLAKPPETFQCDLCEAILYSEKTFKEHRNRHLQTFQVYCDQCGKGFVSKGALKSHMIMHTDEKRFKCDLCEQSFKWKKQLKAHILRHKDEKPYVCATCGKGFVLQQHLKYHEEYHIGEKKHPCPECGRLFHSVHAKHTHIYHSHRRPDRRKQMRLMKHKGDAEAVDGTDEVEGVMKSAEEFPSDTSMGQGTKQEKVEELVSQFVLVKEQD